MRRIIKLEPDVEKAVDRLRTSKHVSLSDAVNERRRRELEVRLSRSPFKQRTAELGVDVDISCIAGALELIEGRTGRWLRGFSEIH